LIAESRGARVITVAQNALISLSVRGTGQRARILYGDGQGATHAVSLQPVTFGSQEFIERNASQRVSTSDQRGAWY
jgi:hypothetical protein